MTPLLTVAELVAPGTGGVSLAVDAGAIVALAGHDTSRTAIVQAIAGLERARGSIALDGTEIAGLAPDRIAALGLGYIPAGRRVFPGLTVDENLTLGAYRERRDRPLVGQRRERAYALFPRLAGRRAQIAGTLSGGEQQMLVIARGLMSEPRVLLLDEPSAGLGPTVIDALATALEATRDAGTGILLADEGLQLVRRLADRVLLFEDGRVEAVALTDPRLGVGYIT